MHTDSSAMATCLRLRSTVECTATVRMPMAWQARSTRSAISPRLAMTTLSSIWRSRAVLLRRGEGNREQGTGNSTSSVAARRLLPFPAPCSPFPVPASSTDHEHRLVELHRLAVLDQDGADGAGDVGLDRVEHLHRLDDAQRFAG